MPDTLLLLALGLPLAAAAGLGWLFFQERRSDRIPILLYHRVVEDGLYLSLPRPENIFSVPEGRFRDQLDYLRRAGYTTIDPAGLEAFLREGRRLPALPVLITFDDGSESVHSRALPLLRERAQRAAVFVTTDPDAWVFREHPRSERRLSAAQMRDLEAGGVSVESHGASHRALNSMTEEEALRELVESKSYLEGVAGREVRYVAIPLNYYSRRILDLARRAGYRMVFTSDAGTNHAGSDPFRLRRFIVEGSATLEEFARLLTPVGMVQRRVIAGLKRLPPRLVGYRLWMPVRRVLYRSILGPLLTPRHLRRALIAGAALLAVLAAAALVFLWRRAG